jgi:hypothetical protein
LSSVVPSISSLVLLVRTVEVQSTRQGTAMGMFGADEAKPATGGQVSLYIDGRPVGKGRIDHTVPTRFSGHSGMDIGRDNGASSTRATTTRIRSRSPAP